MSANFTNETLIAALFPLSHREKYINERLSIGSAVFIAYLLHYIAFGAVNLMKIGKDNELRVVEKNMFLFAIAGILSCNLLQSGVYQAVLCYFNLICLGFIHLPIFDSSNKYFEAKKWFWFSFYFTLFCWYFGIIVDYYDSYSLLEA